MTRYEKLRKELHEALAEFTRLTGTGNVKLANLVMIQIVHYLVNLMEAQPKCKCACGSSAPVVPPSPPLPASVAAPAAPSLSEEIGADNPHQAAPLVPTLAAESVPIMVEPIPADEPPTGHGAVSEPALSPLSAGVEESTIKSRRSKARAE